MYANGNNESFDFLRDYILDTSKEKHLIYSPIALEKQI